MKFLKDLALIWNAFVERVLYILDPEKFSEEKDYLRMQIQVERNEKMRIVELFSSKSEESDDNFGNTEQPKPVNPYIPWRVRRAQLENANRIKVQVPGQMSQTQKDIANLEEELEIEHAD